MSLKHTRIKLARTLCRVPNECVLLRTTYVCRHCQRQFLQSKISAKLITFPQDLFMFTMPVLSAQQCSDCRLRKLFKLLSVLKSSKAPHGFGNDLNIRSDLSRTQKSPMFAE